MALAKSSLRNARHPPAPPDERESPQPLRKPPTQKPKINTTFNDNSEYSDLAEKILQNLNSFLEKDELLDEFDLLPVESKSNHSPVLHINSPTEHKLAVESWCVPYLFTHSYKSFLAIRRKIRPSSSSTSPSSPSSQHYGSLKASNLSESEKITRGLLLSRVLLLLNPDFTLAWNFRREFQQKESYEYFQCELRLVRLVASRKPKCPEGFSYRRWLVNHALKSSLISREYLIEWFSSETLSLDLPITRYFSNYHAWHYRFWLLQRILQEISSEEGQGPKLVLESELEFSNHWMNTQVSDYCGHHYRQKLFQLMAAEDSLSDSIEKRLCEELSSNSKRILSFEGHESLWYHRRETIHQLVKLLEENATKAKHETEIQLQIQDLKEEEESLIKKLRAGKSSTECSQLNEKLSKQYSSWLWRRFKWNFH